MDSRPSAQLSIRSSGWAPAAALSVAIALVACGSTHPREAGGPRGDLERPRELFEAARRGFAEQGDQRGTRPRSSGWRSSSNGAASGR